MSANKEIISLTWLVKEKQFIHYALCELSGDYDGDQFWLKNKSEENAFLGVWHSSGKLFVACDESLVPSRANDIALIRNFVGFYSTSTCHDVVQSVIQKCKVCDTVTPLLICRENESFFLIVESDVPVVTCAIQELWDEKYRYVFYESPVHFNSLESRQLTILASVCRFYKPIELLPKSLTIHCVGAESKEFSEFSSVISSYSMLFNSLSVLGVSELALAFIGPNLYIQGEPLIEEVLFGGKICVKVSASCNLYHDYIQKHHEFGKAKNLIHSFNSRIDLVVLFQAGLWGYDTWHPTLDLLSALKISQILVTSYSLSEAESDFDVIKEKFCRLKGDDGTDEAGEQCIWNFEDEINPYACSEPIHRISAPDCSYYYDNFAWQSVSFIDKED